jgi:hypothetical protein
MRSLILAENLYSSGKLAVLLYLLTRLGGLANTLSLISLGWVAAFVLPKVHILKISYCKDDFHKHHYYILVKDGIFKLLRSPGNDSKESIPPAYVSWRAGTTPYSFSVPNPP